MTLDEREAIRQRNERWGRRFLVRLAENLDWRDVPQAPGCEQAGFNIPDLRRAATDDNLSATKRDHLVACPYCQNKLRLYQQAIREESN